MFRLSPPPLPPYIIAHALMHTLHISQFAARSESLARRIVSRRTSSFEPLDRKRWRVLAHTRVALRCVRPQCTHALTRM